MNITISSNPKREVTVTVDLKVSTRLTEGEVFGRVDRQAISKGKAKLGIKRYKRCGIEYGNKMSVTDDGKYTYIKGKVSILFWL